MGWKALCRTLSDVAAMGGEPLHALISVFSPRIVEWPTGNRYTGGFPRQPSASELGSSEAKLPGLDAPRYPWRWLAASRLITW